jgi:hypothetical protein
MTTFEKILIGALGGLSAVLVKFLGQDYSNVVAHAADLTAKQMLGYQIGYGILTPILMFLGAFVGWISDEDKRLKLAALAIAAPAMITTWAGGNKPEIHASVNFFVSSAFAEVNEPPTPFDPKATNDKSTLGQIKDGVGIFFGYGKEPKRYWVIVGSYKDRDEAQRFADRINSSDSSIRAWVGIRSPNDYYPVIVGSSVLLSDAHELRSKALKNPLIKEAYLSPVT